MTDIDRIDRPDLPEIERAIARNSPLVFRGAFDGQAAVGWDIDPLRQRLGPRVVKIVRGEDPRQIWDLATGLAETPTPFDAYARDAFGPSATGYSYLQDDINNLPELKGDYALPPFIHEKGILRHKFWLSGSGLVTPLHYDPGETFHWLVRGTKRFLLYPPGIRNYYPHPADSAAPIISRVDPEHPDLKRFPMFRKARPLEFRMNAGDVLYLPAFWWHQVYSEGPVNISLNFIWFASDKKNRKHARQFSRVKAHIDRQLAKIKAAKGG